MICELYALHVYLHGTSCCCRPHGQILTRWTEWRAKWSLHSPLEYGYPYSHVPLCKRCGYAEHPVENIHPSRLPLSAVSHKAEELNCTGARQLFTTYVAFHFIPCTGWFLLTNTSNILPTINIQRRLFLHAVLLSAELLLFYLLLGPK